jgi:hypothetical protein
MLLFVVLLLLLFSSGARRQTTWLGKLESCLGNDGAPAE